MKKILTIAGSDSGGGAGIQADLKTIQVHGMYGMSVITAVTAQNTQSVFQVDAMSPKSVEAQLDAVLSDLLPDAVKIGMVYDTAVIHIIAEKLKQYQPPHIVVDTPMISSSGQELLLPEAKDALLTELLPLAELITPNLPETEQMTGMTIRTTEDMEASAKMLQQKYQCQVLIKGGHLISQSSNKADTGISNVENLEEREINHTYSHISGGHNDEKDRSVIAKEYRADKNVAKDYLIDAAGTGHWFYASVIHSKHTHGTGCTLSSAIACNLADGFSMVKAVECAKEYLHQAIAHAPKLGNGSGPVAHGWNLKRTDRMEAQQLQRLTAELAEKELLIFDFDGTLLDSMDMWDHVATDYIRTQGMEPPDGMEEKLMSMTLEESGEYFIRECGLQKSVEEYIQDIYEFVLQRYRNDLVLKPGAATFIRQMCEAGKKMCILTSTGRPCVEAACVHYGLEQWIPFSEIDTCSDLGMNKRSPEIYCHVAEQMGVTPQQTAVFEDAPFAVKSAKQAGCLVCAVDDPSAQSGRAVIEEYADYQIPNFLDLVENK